jgi:hypothetical protein
MGATMNAPANSSELILWRIMAISFLDLIDTRRTRAR